MLREAAKNGDRQTEGQPETMSHDVTFSAPPSLSEIGTSRIQSSLWQQLADIPEEKFEETIR
jgi:hypothetical protein